MFFRFIEKNHTRRDFVECVRDVPRDRVADEPTFVVFSPWTTLESYLELLNFLVELDLVDNVSPVQYAIRLLIPALSRLLELEEVQKLVGEFDQQALMYPWLHPDQHVDEFRVTLWQRFSKASPCMKAVGKSSDAFGISLIRLTTTPSASIGRLHARIRRLRAPLSPS